MDENLIVTKEGIAKVKKDLADCLELRKEILIRVDTARQLGDLSENAEYHAAREEQRNNDRKIRWCEHMIKFAHVVDESQKGTKTITFGNTVIVKTEEGDKKEFKIVGHSEADPLKGLISHESPIGRALVGRQKGEEVEVVLPKKTILYTIIDIH